MTGVRTRFVLATWLLLALVAVLPTGVAAGSMPVMLATALLTSLALALVHARHREPVPGMRCRTGVVVGAVLPLVKQDHPDAAGHIRSRAPGFSSATR